MKRLKPLREQSLPDDALQNELIVIGHHVDDAEEALDEENPDYAREALKDIREALKRLSAFLTPDLTREILRVTKL